jgi:hypothetical protein
VPADDGFWFDNYQDLGPPGPDAPEKSPEQPVQRIQPRTRPFPFENGHLLPQSEDLQGSIMPTADESSDSGHKSEDEFEHKPSVVT